MLTSGPDVVWKPHRCLILRAKVHDGASQFWIQGDGFSRQVGWGAGLFWHACQAVAAGGEAEFRRVAGWVIRRREKE